MYSTARSFCREALAAAVACSRKLIGRAGGEIVADDPRWFLEKFVVKMASPLLLGDAVGALLRAASAPASSSSAAAAVAPASSVTAGALEARGGLESVPTAGFPSGRMGAAVREVILPGAVERLTKVTVQSRRSRSATRGSTIDCCTTNNQSVINRCR